MVRFITGNALKEFMVACDQVESGYGEQYKLYCKLITEEFNETIEADNVTEIIDGVIDSIWVSEGLKNTIDYNKYHQYDVDYELRPFLLNEYVDLISKFKNINTNYKLISQLFDAKILSISEIDDYIVSLIEYGLKFVDIVTLQDCWDEVKRSNMSKISENGKVLKNEFGKVVKPETFSPADIKSILQKHFYI